MSRLLRGAILIGALAAVGLTGCGVRGPLYLPPKGEVVTRPPPAATAPTGTVAPAGTAAPAAQKDPDADSQDQTQNQTPDRTR